MEQYARRRTPFPIFFPRNQNTRTACARDPKTRSHCGENGQTDRILYDLLGDLLKHSLFALRYALGRRSIFFGVESIFCKLSQYFFSPKQPELEMEDILQNDLRILAALSHSLSRVVGQNASEPILFESLLTGAPTVDVSFHPRLTDHSSLTFVRPAPGFIEALLASSLRLVPRREDGSHLLHRGSII